MISAGPNQNTDGHTLLTFHTVSEDDQELAARIINEENIREEHLRGNTKHHIRVKGETMNANTSKFSKNDSSDKCSDTENNDMIASAKNLKQFCEIENLSEVPSWFSKSKDVRLQTCFPNAFDPKYLMAKRKLFKQMKLLKEEQEAAKSKNTSAVIKLTPCAPPTFAKNLKFKPIKGHVMKPAEKSVSMTSTPAANPKGTIESQENRLENIKCNESKDDSGNDQESKIENSADAKLQADYKNSLQVKTSNVDKEKESHKRHCDIYEEEKPKSRRSRRKV